ncbi:MAG: hypothetical protein HC836_16730 [Richelia sp. RM2_1_2]|nr:hypothetical protein [Richelia sp. RM2_1_2]
MKLRTCTFCNTDITAPNFTRHVSACNGLGTLQQKQAKIKEETQYIKENGIHCPHCAKVLHTKAGLVGHIFRCHTAIGKEQQKIATEKSAMMINTGVRKAPSGWITSKETKEKISKALEGKWHHIHYSKREFYNGVWLDSTYESILARELDANNIAWTRPSPLIYVDANEQQRRYYPDFYLIDYNVYLDPKNNYLAEKIKKKLK